jgi:pimeloyl-ACP methyl ester carboxylesterase
MTPKEDGVKGAARYAPTMSEERGYLTTEDGERIAWRRVAGRGPTLVWLGGFRSDMAGTKAEALAEWAKAAGRAFVRFDYLGHGESSGDFAAKGTITRWRADALAVIDQLTDGRLVLVGSSMGGWIACLAAIARPNRVAAMALIAPAPDFTEKLMSPGIPPEGRAALERDGVWLRPSLYDDQGYPITHTLLEDGARWSILGSEPVPIEVPVRILQGGQDPDVPWTHALALAQQLNSDDVVFTLIKDGDHRLSRPQDIARLIAVIEELTD